MSDRYIPNPHDGQYRPRTWAEDAKRDAWAAEDRGNPYPYGTGRWFAWNEGHAAAVRQVIHKIAPARKESVR